MISDEGSSPHSNQFSGFHLGEQIDFNLGLPDVGKRRDEIDSAVLYLRNLRKHRA